MPPVRDHPDLEQSAESEEQADGGEQPVGEEPTCRSYASLLTEIRGLIRLLMSCKLKELTNNPKASMKWGPVHYALGVVFRGRFRLVGWPEGVPFGNLSDIPGGQPVLEQLLSLWLEGKMYFEAVDDEYRDLAKRNPKAVLPAPPPKRKAPRCFGPCGRNDIGKGRARPVTNPEGRPLRRRKDGPLTPKICFDSDVEDSDEIDSDVED
ncbi:hypothetical protein VTO73DRAFT_11399 [Trametes versicolor]